MNNTLTLLAALLITIPALSQERSKFLYGEFADKAVTLYPFYKPFGGNFDPAVTLGGGFDVKQKGSLTKFQTFQATGFKTPFIGRGITLTTSLGYRYPHSSGLFGEATVGLGAIAFFPSRETFTQDENNIYVHSTPLHLNAAIPVDLVLGYSAGAISCPYEYARFIRELMRGNILDSSTLETMLSDKRQGPVKIFQYGLGIIEWDVDNRISYGHDGNSLGTLGTMMYLPGSEMTLAVSVNMGGIFDSNNVQNFSFPLIKDLVDVMYNGSRE